IQGQLVDLRTELKDSARIVIEATYNQRVKCERHAIQLQKLLYRGKVFATRIVQVLGNFGRNLNLRLVLRFFAIQQAQRILVKAHLAVLATIVEQGLIILFQSFYVLRSAIAVSNAINRDTDMVQTERLIELIEQSYHLGINGWIATAQ